MVLQSAQSQRVHLLLLHGLVGTTAQQYPRTCTQSTQSGLRLESAFPGVAQCPGTASCPPCTHPLSIGRSHAAAVVGRVHTVRCMAACCMVPAHRGEDFVQIVAVGHNVILRQWYFCLSRAPWWVLLVGTTKTLCTTCCAALITFSTPHGSLLGFLMNSSGNPSARDASPGAGRRAKGCRPVRSAWWSCMPWVMEVRVQHVSSRGWPILISLAACPCSKARRSSDPIRLVDGRLAMRGLMVGFAVEIWGGCFWWIAVDIGWLRRPHAVGHQGSECCKHCDEQCNLNRVNSRLSYHRNSILSLHVAPRPLQATAAQRAPDCCAAVFMGSSKGVGIPIKVFHESEGHVLTVRDRRTNVYGSSSAADRSWQQHTAPTP